MKILTHGKIYKILHDHDMQISKSAINDLDGFVQKLLITTIENIKNDEHNIKRISGEMLISYIIKNIKQSHNGNGNKPCQKCAGIKDVFIKAARDLQVIVTDEAKIALLALEKGERYVK